MLRLLTSAPLLGRLSGWGAFAQSPSGAATNAADVYRRTFAWSEAVWRERWQEVYASLEAPRLGPDVDRWLKEAQPALRTLREAASIKACRWGDENLTVEGIDRDRLEIGHNFPGRMACLSARRLAEKGRFEESLDDAFAALSFARRIGEDGVLIARLFQCAGETAACQTLGRILPLLDRPALASLANRLDASPPPAPFSTNVLPESRFILGSLRGLLSNANAVLTEDDWARLKLDADETAILKRLSGGERVRLLAHLDEAGPAFEELGRVLDLQLREREGALGEFARTHRETAILAVGFIEHAQPAATAVERIGLIFKMLRAGVLLIRDGEPAFLAPRDPYAAGPFGLERRGEGLILRSAFPGVKTPTTEFAIGFPT